MVDHVRKQIRDAVATKVTGLTTTGARVFTSRVYPLERADLPGLLVRIAAGASETIEPASMHSPLVLDRTLPLEVVGVARAVDDLDDLLDTITKEVEIALAMPIASLAGIAKDITLRSVQVDMLDGTEKPVGTVTLQYDVNYFTYDNAPTAAL